MTSSILGTMYLYIIVLYNISVVLLQIAIDEKDGDAKELLKKELWYVMSYCIAQYLMQ